MALNKSIELASFGMLTGPGMTPAGSQPAMNPMMLMMIMKALKK